LLTSREPQKQRGHIIILILTTIHIITIASTLPTITLTPFITIKLRDKHRPQGLRQLGLGRNGTRLHIEPHSSTQDIMAITFKEASRPKVSMARQRRQRINKRRHRQTKKHQVQIRMATGWRMIPTRNHRVRRAMAKIKTSNKIKASPVR
jgi:hypothetical protein